MVVRRPPLLAVSLALALGLALFLAATPARAAVWIERYAVDVTMPPAGKKDAAYTLTFVYRTDGERKRDGFKFVGSAPITGLWATDAQDAPVRARVSREASSGEHKIEFDIPPPDGAGRQTVKIGFLQPLSIRGFGWGYRAAEIPWAPTFRVPVHSMEVAVSGPSGLDATGDFKCRGRGPVSCSRVTSGTQPVTLMLPSAESGALLGGMVLMLLLLGSGLVLVVRKRHRELLALRGVIPPASPVAYPPEAHGYRAPPVLPVEEEAEPVLPAEERAKLVERVAIGAGALLFSIVVAAAFGGGLAPAPMPVTVSMLAVLGALLTWPFLVAEKVLGWLPVALLSSTIAVPILSSLAGLAVGGVVLVIWLFTLMPKGAGGSSGGSSCSSSSCGGGGGGCGGGGGGGGCGG